MSVLEFISSILSALAWPVAIIVIVIVLSRALSGRGSWSSRST
jgi:hypothetical protein